MNTSEINTLIGAATLGMLTWLVYTVHSMATRQAGYDEKHKQHEERHAENRSRIIDVEKEVGRLNVDVSRIKHR